MGKTKTMVVSRACAVHSQLTPLTLGGTVSKESTDLITLGVMFADKVTLLVSSAAAQRLGII